MDLDPIAPAPKKPPMPPIDLTLAINFIPAVVCLLKASLISFSLSVLRPGQHLGGFVVFAMMLNIDRAVSCARIFDENAVQCCILAAWGINFLRTTVQYAPKILNPAATVGWLCFACCLVLEPKAVQEFFVMYGHGSGGVFKRVLPGIVTGLFIVVMAFIPFQAESSLVTSARSIGFSCLCVAWVYVVSVWRPKPRHNGSCVFECHLLLSRFCPILYIDRDIAVFYSVCCVVILAYHYVQIHVSSSSCQCLEGSEGAVSFRSDLKPDTNLKFDTKIETKIESMFGDECQSLTEVKIMMSDTPQMNTIEEEDEDLEALFRSACMNRQQ